jgi:hypothetical protein
MIKFVDITVFILLTYLGLSYYTTNAHIFDLVCITALVYVLVRRTDINTKTLVMLGIMYKIIDSVVLYQYQDINPFVFYTVLILLNAFFAYLVIHRPVHFSQFGPWKGKSGFTITNQDDIILLFLVVQVIWMVLLLIETATRRINEWFYENSRILYDVYEEIQIVFAVISLLVVWFMTTDTGKEDSKLRQVHNQ